MPHAALPPCVLMTEKPHRLSHQLGQPGHLAQRDNWPTVSHWWVHAVLWSSVCPARPSQAPSALTASKTGARLARDPTAPGSARALPRLREPPHHILPVPWRL